MTAGSWLGLCIAAPTAAAGVPGEVDDGIADRVVDAIRSAANNQSIGDGKIFVYDLGEAVRIRTGETGKDAL